MDFNTLIKSADPDKDFLDALHKAQREFGKTHEAVQQALSDTTPEFELAIKRHFEKTVDIVSRLKLYVDKNNWWE